MLCRYADCSRCEPNQCALDLRTKTQTKSVGSLAVSKNYANSIRNKRNTGIFSDGSVSSKYTLPQRVTTKGSYFLGEEEGEGNHGKKRDTCAWYSGYAGYLMCISGVLLTERKGQSVLRERERFGRECANGQKQLYAALG